MRDDAERLQRGCALFFLIGCLALVGWTLSNYSITWMHPEIFLAEERHVDDLETMGLSTKAFHAARFFDCHALSDNCDRTRLASYYIGYLNPFFRLWIEKYLPPHPSLSLNWLFAFAALFALYRLIAVLTRDRTAALLGSGLYAVSAGFLSLVVMLFNPGKPLAACFVGFALYAAAIIARDRKQWHAPLCWLLYALLLLAYLSDETSWALPLYLFILFPGFLRRENRPLAICIASTMLIFLVFVTFEAPILARFFWRYQYVNLWSFAFQEQGPYAFDQRALLLGRLFNAVRSISWSMFLSEFAWWRGGAVLAAASLVLLGGAVGAAAVVAKPEPRNLFLRVLLLFVVSTVFQCAVQARIEAATGTYYYNSLFSFYGALLVATAFHCLDGRSVARWCGVVVSLYLAWISYTWFLDANGAWMAGHDAWFGQLVGDEYGPQRSDLTEAKVASDWNAVRNGRDLPLAKTAFAPMNAWLFEELSILQRR